LSSTLFHRHERYGSKITDAGFLFVFFLVFNSSVVHSCVDYVIATAVWLPLRKIKGVSRLPRLNERRAYKRDETRGSFSAGLFVFFRAFSRA
jgi:uncharacterized membrane protein